MPRRRRPPRAGALTELPPLKILTQIFLLQCAYYTCATLLLLFSALVAGTRFSLDLLLGWRSLRGDTTVGWMLGLVWMLNSFIGVVFLLLLISRSKLIPDFAITLHIIHLLLTTLYSRSVPTNLLWWALQFASAAQMTLLGMYTCQWRELRPITFGAANPSSSSHAHQNHENDRGDGSMGSEMNGLVAGEPVDEELGYGRGRKKSRFGRDGAGDYELVAMKDGGGGSG